MGLNLDFVPELVKPLAPALAGGAFPEVDVDRIFSEADVLERLADVLSEIKAEDADRLLASLRDHEWKGEAKDAFQAALAQLTGGAPSAGISGGALLKQLEDAIRSEAANLREYGVQMEHAQWMIYAALAMLAVFIARVLVWIYFNGPAVFAAIHEQTLLTRMSIYELKRQVLANMAKFAAIMGIMDGGVQKAQKEWGHREHYDVGSLLLSVGSGALSGAVFAGAAFGVSRLATQEVRYVASKAELSLRDKVAAVGESLYGRALLGGLSATAGGVPGLAMSGQLDSSHLFYTFVSGVAGGLDIPAGARVTYHPLAAAELGGTTTGDRSGPYGTPSPESGGHPAFPYTGEAGRHPGPAPSVHGDAHQASPTAPDGPGTAVQPAHGNTVQPSHTTPDGHGTAVQPAHTTLAGVADRASGQLDHLRHALDGGRPESASAVMRDAPAADPRLGPVRIDAGTVVYPAGTHSLTPQGDGGHGGSGAGEGGGSGGKPVGPGDRPAGTGQVIGGEVVRRQDSPLPAAPGDRPAGTGQAVGGEVVRRQDSPLPADPGDTARGAAVAVRQPNEVSLAGDQAGGATAALLRASAPINSAPLPVYPSVLAVPHDDQSRTDAAASADQSAPHAGAEQRETQGAPSSLSRGPEHSPAPRPSIDEIINKPGDGPLQSGAVRQATPERPPTGRSAPLGDAPLAQQERAAGSLISAIEGSGKTVESATVPQPIHPPRYVEIGALGETALHEVRIPADPGAVAQKWVDGIGGDLSPEIRTAIKTWLTERLADADRDNWTDLLQKGAALGVGKDVVYLKPELRDFSPMEKPTGHRPYAVSFGGDGVDSRNSGVRNSELTGGLVRMLDTSDEVEALGLPSLGVRHSSRMSESNGTDIMSGRKTVIFKHDFFEAGLSLGIYRNGVEIPYGAVIPELSVVVPFPAEFSRVGPLTPGSGPPALPRHEVPAGAARKIPDYGVLITAVETLPLTLAVQRRLVEAGVPSHQIVKIVDDLMSTVHSEQAMKNRSQWWLTSGSASEAVRYTTSRFHSTEDSFRVTSSILRMEPVAGSREAPTATAIRPDLGRRTAGSSTSQEGNTGTALVGFKLDVGTTDKIVARAGGSLKVGKAHSIATSQADLPKVNFLEKTDVVLYDAVVRLHVATEKLGAFDVDVRMEMGLPVREADGFERDVFGKELTPPQQESAQSRELAEIREELAKVREEFAIPHTEPVQPHGGDPRTAYEPHPQEPPMLAAGRGPGLGTLTRLTGGQHLVTEIHDALIKAAPDLPQDALRQVRQDLDKNFGRPALEGDFTHLLNGIHYRATAGDHHIEVSARGTLGALNKVDEFPMTVNERRTTGTGVTTGWTTLKGFGFEGAVNLRIKVKKVFGIDFPKIVVKVMTGSTDKTAFASGHSVYRRTETEGPVTAFKKAVPIEVELRVTKNGKEVTDVSWRVDGSTAEIVVPHQHVPQQPVSAQEVAGVGRIEPLDRRPDDVVDFKERPAGVIRIGAMPDLALALGKAHAEWTGLPSPEKPRDVPAEIFDVTRPSYLEANIGLLTSPDGLTVKLPEHQGWNQELRMKVSVAGLERTKSGAEVEYEHYANASTRVITGKGRTAGLEAQALVGTRATLGDSGEGETGTRHKFVATAGATFSTGRNSTQSAYTGGMDVARSTYGAESHWYRGDLVVEATPIRWKGDSVEQGPPTRLRVNQIVDLMTPEQVARHLGLEGPAPDVAVVTEPRAYISPELAMHSAHVEHLDAANVLPELVGVFHEQRILFEGEELTTSPVMEALRSRYSEQALAANLVTLRTGADTWLPVKGARGFTEYVGVRVRAVVLDGAHTAERPDVKLMLRSEHLSGAGNTHEAGSGHGARALMRYSRSSDSDLAGAEVSARSTSDSGTSHTGGTNVKEINRVQTSDPSHEFTHPVRYEIEVVRSQEPPPGLEHLVRGTRGVLHKWAELTGNDAAVRFWDERRSTSAVTRVTSGELRVLVPEHVTVPVAEGTPVTAQTTVVGEAPRWAKPVTPLAVNATLGEIANQVAFPAASLVEQWAPVAALPPKLRGPVPSLSDRPLGFDLSSPAGMLLSTATGPGMMRANLKALLAHEYVIPGLGKVGIQAFRAEKVTEASVKQRVYSQTMTTSGHGHGSSKERDGRVGLSVRPSAEGAVGIFGVGGGRGSGGELASRNNNIRERNLEANTENAYYRVVGSLVFHNEGRDLVIDVPDGLYIRLSPDDVDRLNREHPGFIR
ncbi:hypothetical protein OHA77_21880 [Streptosporangium sp. NBC_01639]|uniref:WXG100 family type VII secretion target n=1 Tax=Streptosporangium sp. NBC_01639 TaxID=2975948 RepID=UPI0038664A19|nr:hypothetical protein OHA77_21880 [Streptosporangium sp. NBC_01639]